MNVFSLAEYKLIFCPWLVIGRGVFGLHSLEIGGRKQEILFLFDDYIHNHLPAFGKGPFMNPSCSTCWK